MQASDKSPHYEGITVKMDLICVGAEGVRRSATVAPRNYKDGDGGTEMCEIILWLI